MSKRRASQPEVRKDPDTGKWWFQIDAPSTGGNRRRIHRSGFHTKGEAQDVLRDLLDERAEIPASRRYTVRQMVDAYLAGVTHRSVNTQNQYRWSLTKLVAAFGGRAASDLTRDDIERWVYGLDLSDRSKHTIIKHCRAAWDWAIDDRILTANPARRVPLPTVEPTRKYWTPEQVQAWVAKGDEVLPCVGLARFAADTALRRGELCGIRWANLDLKAGIVTVEKQLMVDSATGHATLGPLKRPRKHSRLALHPDTISQLKARRRQQEGHRTDLSVWPDHDLVWTWPDGRHLDPNWWTRKTGDIAETVGLPKYGPHVLRHSFAAAALAAGVAIEVVSLRLGHASVRITHDLYGHLLPAQDAAVALAVGDLLLPKVV